MDIVRVLQMYTTWNLVSFVVTAGFNVTWMQPYLRWNSLLIVIGVLVSIVISGSHPFADVIRSVTGWPISDSFSWLLDGLVHLVPVIWVGLPASRNGFLSAMVGMAVWYALMRSRIREIYTPTLTVVQYDRITLIVLVIGIMIYGVI